MKKRYITFLILYCIPMILILGYDLFVLIFNANSIWDTLGFFIPVIILSLFFFAPFATIYYAILIPITLIIFCRHYTSILKILFNILTSLILIINNILSINLFKESYGWIFIIGFILGIILITITSVLIIVDIKMAKKYPYNEFLSDWFNKFTPNIDDEFINEYVYENGFIWYVFSYEKVDKSKYLCGLEAQKEYEKISKKDALVYLYDEEKVIPINKKYLNTKKILKSDSEIYIYDKNYSWCYINTHESDNDLESYGPYFIKIGI